MSGKQHKRDFQPGGGLKRRFLLILLMLLPLAATAGTAPWLSTGDAGLRSDVELLAAYGLAGGPITTWPIPTRQLLHGLSDQTKLDQAPPDVQLAAQRVLAALSGPDPDSPVHPLARLMTTNQPALVRDFGSQARDEADVAAGADYDAGAYNARLLIGEQTHYNGSGARFALDGSYVGARWDNLQFYGGWLDQWYGPGETSSLILSDNARPFPKVGVMRADPLPFETPWLSWLGPYQVNFFVGVLDGPRINTNTGFVSLRFTFEPVTGLEIGLTRETEICGSNHPCNPVDYFRVNNGPTNPDKTNDEAGIDFKYTRRFGPYSLSPYVQFMNEDTGPFVHSATSYLVGTTLTRPFGTDGAYWTLTAEYADSVATQNWFDFGKKLYGVSYNDYKYVDGFRYQGRTLGFSLDDDSRLFTLTWRLTDSAGRRWHLTYDHADVGILDPASTSTATHNVVTSQPFTVNIGEAGVDWPWGPLDLQLTLRGQDAQPVPQHGAYLSGEVGIRYGFRGY